MHELSIAQSLMDIITQEAERHGLERVVRVGVSLGEFSAVVPESLTFCFDLIKEGTVAEGAELAISKVPLRGLCQECGHDFDMDQPVMDCPQCGGHQIQLISGRELSIDFIETDEPEQAPGDAKGG